jgi:hypothetical protein
MKIKNQNGEWVDIPKLMPCPDCKKEVSRNAASCPHCGRVMKQSATSLLAVIILALMAIGFVVWLLRLF